MSRGLFMNKKIFAGLVRLEHLEDVLGELAPVVLAHGVPGLAAGAGQVVDGEEGGGGVAGGAAGQTRVVDEARVAAAQGLVGLVEELVEGAVEKLARADGEELPAGAGGGQPHPGDQGGLLLTPGHRDRGQLPLVCELVTRGAAVCCSWVHLPNSAPCLGMPINCFLL